MGVVLFSDLYIHFNRFSLTENPEAERIPVRRLGDQSLQFFRGADLLIVDPGNDIIGLNPGFGSGRVILHRLYDDAGLDTRKGRYIFRQIIDKNPDMRFLFLGLCFPAHGRFVLRHKIIIRIIRIGTPRVCHAFEGQKALVSGEEIRPVSFGEHTLEVLEVAADIKLSGFFLQFFGAFFQFLEFVLVRIVQGVKFLFDFRETLINLFQL